MTIFLFSAPISCEGEKEEKFVEEELCGVLDKRHAFRDDKLYSISTVDQHELPYRQVDKSRSPVRDVVHKNSAEPKAEMWLAYSGEQKPGKLRGNSAG